MATTVGQHSVAAFTSPVNGTTPIDANTVRGNDNTVRVAYVDHDADPGIHVQSSTLASRPAAGTAGRKWITEDSGVYTLWFDDGTNWHPVSSENVALTVLATETLVKGDVVKVTGWNNGQDLPEVAKVASASDTAFAVMTAAVASGAMGYATNTGIVQDVNTGSFSVGNILYPNTSGGFTSTKPTSGNYQPVAFVLRSNTNNGVIFVEFSAPRIVESSANTASTIVLRDASGNFSAGTITAGALTSTGLVTFASLKGTGATTVTNILDEDNMASDSATALATQQSIKAYVDAKVATVDTLAEVLANGNTTGANDIIVNAGQKIRTPVIASQNNATAITIADTTGALTLASALADSNLATISTAGKVSNSATTATSANTASAIVARDASGNFSAGTITAALTGNASTATTLQTARNINGVSFNGSADITVTAAAGTLTGTTLASGVTASSLTSVGTLTSLTVSGNTTLGQEVFRSIDNGVLRIAGGNPAATGAQMVLSGSTHASVPGRLYLEATGTGSFITRTGGADRLTVDSSGNLAVDTNTLYVDAANNRVGIGTASPSSEFHVKGVGEIVRIETTGTTGNGYIAFFDPSASKGYVGYGASGNENFSVVNEENGAMVFSTNGNNLTLDASGNLGLGVTPSAWTAIEKAIEISRAGNGIFSGGIDDVTINSNAYYAGAWKFGANGYANRFNVGSGNGQFQWFVSTTSNSSGAGANASFTQAMTLDASGRLGIGTTSPGYRLDLGSGSGAVGLSQVDQHHRIVTSSHVVGTEYHYGAGTVYGYNYANAAGYNINAVANVPMLFYTNNAERARIDASGNLGVGTTSPSNKLQLNSGRFSITGATVASGFADSTIRIQGSQTMADDATVTVTVANATLLYVSDNSVGQGVLFYADYASGTVVKLADPNNIGAVSDTDGKLCAYKNATTNSATVKNRLGSSKSITVGMFSVSD